MAVFALPRPRLSSDPQARLEDSLADEPAAITEMGPVDPHVLSICFVCGPMERSRLDLAWSRWRLSLRTRPEAKQVAVAAPEAPLLQHPETRPLIKNGRAKADVRERAENTPL